jgi:Flp pilus assembly protein TadD
MWPVLFLLVEVSAQHQSALVAYKQHKFADAVVQFTEALKTEQPGTAEYQESVLFLGQSLFLQAKYADAIPWLEKATGGNSPLPEAAYMLGNACILTQQSERAVKAFARLFQVSPDSAAAHLATAQMMLHKDLDTEAATQARIALEIDSRIPEAHFFLGEVAIYHADFEGAIEELKKEIAVTESELQRALYPARQGLPEAKGAGERRRCLAACARAGPSECLRSLYAGSNADAGRQAGRCPEGVCTLARVEGKRLAPCACAPSPAAVF